MLGVIELSFIRTYLGNGGVGGRGMGFGRFGGFGCGLGYGLCCILISFTIHLLCRST